MNICTNFSSFTHTHTQSESVLKRNRIQKHSSPFTLLVCSRMRHEEKNNYNKTNKIIMLDKEREREIERNDTFYSTHLSRIPRRYAL